MAAILSPYSTVGFYRTPVTKCLLCTMFVSTFSLNIPQFAPLKKYFMCNIVDIYEKGQICQFLSCRSTFLDIKDLICGGLLLYYFRVFERRYGSHKFASFLLATGSTAILLELVALMVSRRFDLDILRGSLGFLASGPFELVFPLFVNYYFDIPRVAQTYVMGVPVTGKMLTYLLGLQMIGASLSSTLCCVCSLMAGLLYRYNIFRIQSWLCLPAFIAKVVDSSLGRLVASAPPQEGSIPMGATLEIQRSQHFEVLEQQMMFSRARDARAFGQLYGNSVNHNNHRDVGTSSVRHRSPAAISDDSDDSGGVIESRDSAGENSRLNESQVQALMEMGFERHKVLVALRTSGNDVNIATSLLLQDT